MTPSLRDRIAFLTLLASGIEQPSDDDLQALWHSLENEEFNVRRRALWNAATARALAKGEAERAELREKASRAAACWGSTVAERDQQRDRADKLEAELKVANHLVINWKNRAEIAERDVLVEQSNRRAAETERDAALAQVKAIGEALNLVREAPMNLFDDEYIRLDDHVRVCEELRKSAADARRELEIAESALSLAIVHRQEVSRNAATAETERDAALAQVKAIGEALLAASTAVIDIRDDALLLTSHGVGGRWHNHDGTPASIIAALLEAVAAAKGG